MASSLASKWLQIESEIFEKIKATAAAMPHGCWNVTPLPRTSPQPVSGDPTRQQVALKGKKKKPPRGDAPDLPAIQGHSHATLAIWRSTVE